MKILSIDLQEIKVFNSSKYRNFSACSIFLVKSLAKTNTRERRIRRAPSVSGYRWNIVSRSSRQQTEFLEIFFSLFPIYFEHNHSAEIITAMASSAYGRDLSSKWIEMTVLTGKIWSWNSFYPSYSTHSGGYSFQL